MYKTLHRKFCSYRFEKRKNLNGMICHSNTFSLQQMFRNSSIQHYKYAFRKFMHFNGKSHWIALTMCDERLMAC